MAETAPDWVVVAVAARILVRMQEKEIVTTVIRGLAEKESAKERTDVVTMTIPAHAQATNGKETGRDGRLTPAAERAVTVTGTIATVAVTTKYRLEKPGQLCGCPGFFTYILVRFNFLPKAVVKFISFLTEVVEGF